MNFLENYLLVMSDITYQILLLIMIHFISLAEVVDVKRVYLYEALEGRIYLECSTGTKNI